MSITFADEPRPVGGQKLWSNRCAKMASIMWVSSKRSGCSGRLLPRRERVIGLGCALLRIGRVAVGSKRNGSSQKAGWRWVK
jgi:hypothetical protein